MTTLSVANIDISIGSSAYQAGIKANDAPYIAESFYLVATKEDGTRYNHHARFKSVIARRLMDEDNLMAFEDIRDQVLAKLEALMAKIKQAGSINLDYWEETDPEYGSHQYIHQGIEAHRAYQERYAN